MSIGLFRRIAGVLLLFGVVYFLAHPLWGGRNGELHVHATLPALTMERLFLSTVAMAVWSASLGWTGLELVRGRPDPVWASVIGLLSYVVLCVALLGSVYFINPSRIHNEDGFWFVFVMNFVPIVQFMSAVTLGSQHNPEPLPPKV